MQKKQEKRNCKETQEKRKKYNQKKSLHGVPPETAQTIDICSKEMLQEIVQQLRSKKWRIEKKTKNPPSQKKPGP